MVMVEVQRENVCVWKELVMRGRGGGGGGGGGGGEVDESETAKESRK